MNQWTVSIPSIPLTFFTVTSAVILAFLSETLNEDEESLTGVYSKVL